MNRLICNMLYQMFSEEVWHGGLPPAAKARPRYTRGAAREVMVKAWTQEEAARFYVGAGRDRRGAAFCFMLSTGSRIGEALGLSWENVELGDAYILIHIRESLVSVNGYAHRSRQNSPVPPISAGGRGRLGHPQGTAPESGP